MKNYNAALWSVYKEHFFFLVKQKYVIANQGPQHSKRSEQASCSVLTFSPNFPKWSHVAAAVLGASHK